MSEKKYSIFQIQGGLGKHIAATAVAQAIKNNYPDRELIVVCAWPELWANLPFVYRVFPLGNTSYFYDEYIDGKDSLIFGNEPYFTTTHINKTLPLKQLSSIAIRSGSAPAATTFAIASTIAPAAI